jgi:hypothetical protein
MGITLMQLLIVTLQLDTSHPAPQACVWLGPDVPMWMSRQFSD